MSNHKVTPEQGAELKAKYYEGVKPKDLATEYGLVLSTVYRHLSGVKLPHRKLNLGQAKEVYDLALKGVPLRRLAKLYEVSHETIRKIKNRGF